MSGVDLEKYMKKHELSLMQVAALTNTDPRTVRKFLDGEKVRPSTRHIYQMLVSNLPPQFMRSFKPLS